MPVLTPDKLKILGVLEIWRDIGARPAVRREVLHPQCCDATNVTAFPDRFTQIEENRARTIASAIVPALCLIAAEHQSKCKRVSFRSAIDEVKEATGRKKKWFLR